jgi:hypothetical protein
VRRLSLFLGIVALAGCDTLISNRMIIAVPTSPKEASSSTPELMAITHQALVSCGGRDEHLSSSADTWLWSDPDHPPGVMVNVRPGPEVYLSQGLYGPVGPTDRYRCVRKALRHNLSQRFGKARVRVK